MPFVSTWQSLLAPGRSRHFFQARPRPAWQTSTPEFSSANAWWLAELSRLIYRRSPDEPGARPGEPTRDEILQAVGLREHRFLNIGNSQAAIVLSGPRHPRRFAVLVFRGTQGTLANWVQNLDALPSAWPGGGMVHRGFKHRFERIWPVVAAEMEGLNRPWFYTGHSLGGAMALLAADVRPPWAVYTYGSPRVGDRRFVSRLARRAVFRLGNRSDIVTGIPLWLRHAGRTCPPENDPGLRPAPRPRRLTAPPAFLADHAPLNYTIHWHPTIGAVRPKAG